MNTATALAHPNIALVKYWGKRDAVLNLPAVGSLSITLDKIWTQTRVSFDPQFKQDSLSLNNREDAGESKRVSACLDLLRKRAGVDWKARIESQNNFPTAAGLASSASGFAALVVAGEQALGLKLAAEEKSALARQGSGSAARSIFGGYVEWARGTRADGSDSVAKPLLDADAWPLGVAVAITSTAAKETGSTEGMNRSAETSPYQQAWVDSQEQDLTVARAAIRSRDFEKLAEISEHSCLKMHALALSARPGLIYWNGATVEGMRRIRALRAQGCPVFFTVDAGPQLKAVCAPEALAKVSAALREIPGVLNVIETGLGQGARIVESSS
ncbi:MAG: diphosphomevalonate decarboxylase [Pseudomonadota bacterium]